MASPNVTTSVMRTALGSAAKIGGAAARPRPRRVVMRVGVFGGTFDPVHLGHLIVAEQAREQAELDRVWFVPSGRPPHKLDKPITSFERRVEMLQLAAAGQEAKFRIDPVERERPGPSYTADTLAELQAHHPADEFFLILGADCLPDLPHWHEPRRIVAAATLLAAARPGYPTWGAAELAPALGVPEEAIRMRVVEVPLVGMSSTDVRRRAAAGRSLLYLLPRAVEVYVREKKLYQS